MTQTQTDTSLQRGDEDVQQVKHEDKAHNGDKKESPDVAQAPIAQSPTRMTRMPSLQQISQHLHHPSPSLTDSSAPAAGLTSPPSASIPMSVTSSQSTPPKLKLAINSTQPNGSNSSSSPYTASPSGRLRLPATAMTRSHSSSSSHGASGSISKKEDLDPFVIPPYKGLGAKSVSSPMESSGSGSSSTGTSMSRGPSKEGYIKGYKDVPSLAAIRERVSFSKASNSPTTPSTSTPPLTAAGVFDTKEIAKPVATGEKPVVKPVDVMSTPVKEETVVVIQDASPQESSSSSGSDDGLIGKRKEHPLQHAWTLFFDSKTFKPAPGLVTPKEGEPQLSDWEKTLVTVGRFDTVEGFARHLNNVRLPSSLARNSNYHMFKNGIRPMWEDPANANGGKWVVLFRSAPHLLDHAWANLTMSLVGEVLDPKDEVCGVVASTRPKIDRIQVWTRSRDNPSLINALGKRIIDCIGLEGKELEAMSMEFQFNANHANPPPNTFIHIPFPGPSNMSNGGPRNSPFPHAPPTPSRLGQSTLPSPSTMTGNGNAGGPTTLLHHPLPQIPRSPLSPRSPMPTGLLQPPGPPPGFTSADANGGGGAGIGGRPLSPSPISGSPRRLSANSPNPFSGPMGGMGGGRIGASPMGSFSRRGSAQSVGTGS